MHQNTLRPIQSTNFEALIQLFQEFSEFEKTPEKMTNTAAQMESEKEFINGFVLVNEKEEIIAYSTFFYAYNSWSGRSIYMDDLYVTPQHRGEGLGTLLINKVIETAKSSGCKQVRWQVSAWNQNAKNFYQSLGAHIDNAQENCVLSLV